MEEESRKSFAQITLYNQLIKEMDDLYRVYAKNCNLSETAFWILYCIREREEEAFTQRERSPCSRMTSDEYINLCLHNITKAYGTKEPENLQAMEKHEDYYENTVI